MAALSVRSWSHFGSSFARWALGCRSRGDEDVEDGAYLSVSSLCWRAASSCATRSLCSMMVVDSSRSLFTKGVHCSANLTKLMNAERMKRVRSVSGRWRSFELKSMMRAACAKRVRWQRRRLCAMLAA